MLIHADCLEALRNLPDNSVDSVVTDPPCRTATDRGGIMKGIG